MHHRRQSTGLEFIDDDFEGNLVGFLLGEGTFDGIFDGIRKDNFDGIFSESFGREKMM